MDFGRIRNISHVDFKLPQDHKSIKKVLGGNRPLSSKVYLGGVLWSDPGFVGTIYPPKSNPKDYVKYYGEQFNTIELNASHYKVPSIADLKSWSGKVPDHFKFCPKIHQSISHAPNLLNMLDYHLECGEIFLSLKDQLGTGFLQLPPQFTPSRSNELMAFLNNNNFPGLAIEFRHPAWFTNETIFNKLCNFLYKKEMNLVLTDTPGRRDVLHMRFTNKTAFVRFNAVGFLSLDQQRIDEWINRAEEWFKEGLNTFYFFVHAPEQVYMPKLVAYFIQQLEKICGIKLEAPVIKQNATNSLFQA